MKRLTSVLHYQKKSDSNTVLSQRIKEIAYQRRRLGCRRIHVLFQREGHCVNIKRVYRLYRSLGLSVKRRTRKRIALTERIPLSAASRPNEY